jgi:NADPH-ferrihemoprotein reductase
MIGPGTGFAPFRGFLQERAALRRCGKLLGPAYLFFGCRSEHHDFIYREEMEDALANETISELHVAFSREFSNRKVYVQDKLMEFSSKLNSVMKDDQGCAGSIYICGNAKGMARDVNRALHSILIREGGYAGYEAEGIIAHLSEAGRYQKDVW